MDDIRRVKVLLVLLLEGHRLLHFVSGKLLVVGHRHLFLHELELSNLLLMIIDLGQILLFLGFQSIESFGPLSQIFSFVFKLFNFLILRSLHLFERF